MKIPAAKGNDILLEEIRQALAPIPGVNEVAVNPTTGSVIIHYDPELQDKIHNTLHHHSQHRIELRRAPALSEVDEIARNLEEEAEFLAEHSMVARANFIEMHAQPAENGANPQTAPSMAR